MKKSFLKEVVVWLLIFTGLVIFSLITYIIASSKSDLFTSLVVYKTYLPESTGIFVGTKVTIHGANTGNVVKTTLMPDGQVQILFNVRKNHTFAITQSSIMQLKNSGTLGDRFVNILTKDLSAPKLKKGSLIPYKKTSSLLSLLTEGGGGESSKQSFQEMITKIDSILDKVNQEGFSGLLSPSQQEDLGSLLTSGKNILQKIDSGEGTLGALIKDRTLYNRLLSLLGHQSKKNYLQDLSERSQKTNKK